MKKENDSEIFLDQMEKIKNFSQDIYDNPINVNINNINQAQNLQGEITLLFLAIL